jgi:hypothetical protein
METTYELPFGALDDAAVLDADGPPNCDVLCADLTGGGPVACAVGDASVSCTMRGTLCGQ